MAELFQRDKSTISRHIKNIFNDGELIRNSVGANFAPTLLTVKHIRLIICKFLLNLCRTGRTAASNS
ncbi:MAG: hypothetical protein PHI24_09790 [Desulfitobacteriaceae bacterium]|nr:hypothetical protein [Desulfitobacteriaceae bacterium]